MAENSGGEKNAAEQVQITRSKRTLVWVVAGVVLSVAAGLGIWLAHKWGALFSSWRKLQALPQNPAWGLIVPLGFVALAVIGVVVLWKGPQWQVARVEGLDSKERFDKRNEARKTLATILGGVAFLTGGYFTWRNFSLAQESLRVSQEGQITDRFTKAIDQLGAVDAEGVKKMVVRLGGIYALERIANESERDHWPIVEVLCTYVRNVAPIKKQQSTRNNQASSHSPHSTADQHPEPDVQAILTVLGRRVKTYEEKETQHLDLESIDVRGAYLHGADLSGANLSGADLSKANLSGANLSGVNLSGADLSKAILGEAHLNGAYLFGANLVRADLREAHLNGAYLNGAYLNGAYLGGADLSKAFLAEAHLSEAILIGAILNGANLVRADLRKANLSGANLGGANLSGADLRDTGNLTQQQVDEAEGDSTTMLPPELHKPANWGKE